MTVHIWPPDTGIKDIEGDWRALRASDMPGIARVWRMQQERLKGTPRLTTFIERMHREWAIETGIIEGLYDIDRGVTQTLIDLESELNALDAKVGDGDTGSTFAAGAKKIQRGLREQQLPLDELPTLLALVGDDRLEIGRKSFFGFGVAFRRGGFGEFFSSHA